jgi:hypothetical protein
MRAMGCLAGRFGGHVRPAVMQRWPALKSPTTACLHAAARELRSGYGSFSCHGHQGFGAKHPAAVPDLQLSLGKIVDTLNADYPAFFERSPDYDIYDECILFEPRIASLDGRSFSAFKGKRAYRRALSTLQLLGKRTVTDGKIKCSIKFGSPCGHNLRVNWTCDGQFYCIPMYISAISVYSISPQAPTTGFLSHRIHRHAIEFLEIHPPSLRKALTSTWSIPMRMEPALALREHGRV